jgi:two-component system, cell cycle sensor histidine kinase and response regulator CckA
MKTHSRFTLINTFIVTIAIISATTLFLLELRTHALDDARIEQQTRITTFWALLNDKGAGFQVRDGKLWVGSYLLSGNTELPDRITEIFGGSATIFLGDERVATNVRKADGNRATGTKLVGTAYDAIFRDGQGYRGEVSILGIPYFAAYDPIRDPGGNIIGVLYVGEKVSEFFALYDHLKGKVIVGAAILTVCFIGLSWLALRDRKAANRALEARDRKMKAILNNIPDLAWLKDSDSRYLAVNPAFAAACALPPEAVVGKTDFDIWPKHLALAYRADDQDVMASGRSKQLEEQLLGNAGAYIWIETIKTPIFSAQGEIVGTTGIARDITERRLTADELRFTHYAVDRSRDGICWLERDGSISYANDSFRHTFLVSPQEFISLSIVDLMPSYTSASWARHWEELETDGSQTFETVGRARDGRAIPIEVSANHLIQNTKGRLCCFIRDISERKRFEEKNLGTLSILSATLESVADGILVLDLALNVVIFNRKFSQLLGLPQDLLVDPDYQKMQSFVLGELKDPELFQVRLAEAFAHPETVSTVVMEFRDGQILERISCPHLIGDRIAGLVLNFRDITMQRKMETHLRNAQKVEALGTLTGGIAHDFNNRLTAIIGYASLMQGELGNPELIKRYLELLLASADRAAELTRGLLAYSRKQTLNPVTINLNTLVREVEKFLPPIMSEGIELCIEYAQLSPLVKADRGQLEQVLLNLVGNAKDAIDGVGRLTIATGVASLNEAFIAAQGYGVPGTYAILAVTDTGVGMAAGTLEKIFEPFFTTKGVGKGTGLGLSIVYGIVKQHGGFINVYSEPGKGCAFWVYLPCVAGGDPGQEPEFELAEALARVGKGETILLIEDDEDVRMSLREMLERNGYGVIEAVDGVDGVAKFRERGASVNLIVVDVIMPRKNGRDAMHEIRKMRSDVKALFVSGYTDDILNKAGFADPGLHFLSKPLSPTSMLAKLRELLD